MCIAQGQTVQVFPNIPTAEEICGQNDIIKLPSDLLLEFLFSHKIGQFFVLYNHIEKSGTVFSRQ